MRLLNVDSLKFTDFRDDNRPPYVAASHRWLNDDEATFQDVRDRRKTTSKGYQKVKAFAKYIREHLSPAKWLWIDTCCINKDSAVELSEAINSMFEWYNSAELCLAYLADVETASNPSSFEKSQWFKRGWTLQELLAPRTVIFLTKGWQVIGHKGGSAHGNSRPFIGPDMGENIAWITGIPEQILHDYGASLSLSVEEKLKWMEGRSTTRPEDMWYALYGILGVTIGTNYGEKSEGARQRLFAAIHQRDQQAVQQADYFRKISEWLSPPDPWTNHESARQRHEPQTGAWLLQHEQYQTWKAGSTRFLWVYGMAGCGKTVLCSTAIEDMRKHCQNAHNYGHVIFYFSFSDNQKQTYENLLRSLVIQLGWREPGLSLLRQAYEKLDRRVPGTDELRKILLSSIVSFDHVFLHLDALDECVEGDGVRQNVLDRVEELLEHAPNLRVFATSRDVPDVRYLVEKISAESLSIAAQTVNADIQKYVSTQLSRDRKLSRLDLATKTLVEETLSQRAGGMFRWVYCQLQELKKSKSTRPKSVKAALHALPANLDDTYERMLNNITDDDRPYAFTLLRWLAYAQSPLSLDELAEASIVDPTDDPAADGVVDREDRGGWGDTLEILAELISVEGADEDESDHTDANPDRPSNSRDGLGAIHFTQPIEKHTKVRLAHFSVKEYLESPRILASSAKHFYLDPVKEHRFLAQSCLVYLIYYSKSSQKTSAERDRATFPLLKYAAKSWYHHASLQRYGSCSRELLLLTTEDIKRAWLDVWPPDPRTHPFEGIHNIGPGLYYASLLGLETVVQQLLSAGAGFNAQGGFNGNALQAASCKGHEKVVQMLLDVGAEVNVQGGFYGNALGAASHGGHEKVVQMLLDVGAEVNAQGGDFSNALQAASYGGYEKVVQMLLDAGAEVNTRGGRCSNALLAAREGYEKVGVEGEKYSRPRRVVSREDYEKVMQMLIDAGAVNP